MKHIETEEMKTIQIEMLDDIHSFCLRNDIKYSLAFGTLIGAIRHKGYIPWDDDIDLIMPREDYERFVSLYASNKYELLERSKDKKYPYAFGKVVDVRTRLEEPTHYQYEKMGVYIDIFPIDGLPDNLKKRQSFVKKSNRLAHFFIIKSLNSNFPMTVKRRMAHLLLKVFLLFLPLKSIVKKQVKMSKQYDYDSSPYVGILSCRFTRCDGQFDRAFFNDYVDVEFAGRTYKAISSYDVFLKKVYGNYLELPPVEKRVSNHFFKCWWKE